MLYDAIVIGGGPAGLQAALTIGRMHRQVLLLDSGEYRNAAVEHAHNLVTNDGRDPAELRAIARAELDRRMADMERSRRMTEHALRCRAHDITTCPRFRSIMDEVVAGTGTWREAEPPADAVPVDGRMPSTDARAEGRAEASGR